MKKSYDVVGAGDGVAGLIASVLLASKGFSCLWLDSAPEDGELSQTEMPALVSKIFWDKCFVPVVRPVDVDLPNAINPTRVRAMQCLLPGMRLDLTPQSLYGEGVTIDEAQDRYLSILSRSMNKPHLFLKEAGASQRGIKQWEQVAANGMSSSCVAGRLAHLRMLSAMSGAYVFSYGALKEALADYLLGSKGDYQRVGQVDFRSSNNTLQGVKVGESSYKGRYYLSEDYAPKGSGVQLHLRCEIKGDVLPVGMGDVVFINPQGALQHPITLMAGMDGDTAVLSIVARFDQAGADLAEMRELVLARVAEIIPFIERYEMQTTLADPAGSAWFGFSDKLQSPSLLNRHKFINPLDKVYACDRQKDGGLDIEGEIHWGIILANAILKDLNRSDNFGGRLKK